MCTVISVMNNKGGVGKTISTGILSQLLCYLGKKVLAIDLDGQCNLSMMLGQYIEDSREVLYGLEPPVLYNISELFKYRLREKEALRSIIYSTTIPQLDIIPASKRHENTVSQLLMNPGNNNIILDRALNCIKEDYDYILIDNAPASNVLTVNSLFASNLIIVPVRLENFSYKGLKETLDTLVFLKEEHNITAMNFGGAFITQAEVGTNIYKQLHAAYLSELGNAYYTTAIRKDIKISEVATNFQPILEYCPDTNAVFDYCNLLLEMKVLDDYSTELLQKSIAVS